MHLGIPAILDFYRRYRQEPALVLATIHATEGSTYRKTGAMMLISADGSFEGLISGGCLEGDLLHHAKGVFETGQPVRVTYDMSAGDDLVWNLGLGCDGVIHLLLQRLQPGSGFDVFERLEKSHGQRRAAMMALVTGPEGCSMMGQAALRDQAGAVAGEGCLATLLEEHAESWPEWRARLLPARLDGSACEVLLVNMPVQTRVLICGAGPDCLPVARVLSELDWDVVIADHRPAFARQDRFPDNCRVVRTRPEALATAVDLDQVDATVIMSHHLENDAAYLRQVATAGMSYIGTLGPRARRGRLQEMAGCEDTAVHGPVGLDIGAELPAAIALSVAAEIHAVLNRRDGQSLTGADHA